MLKIMAFLSKREDLETRAFIEYYEQRHVPWIRSLAPTPIGYKRSYVVRGDAINVAEEAIDFDVVTELIFPDRDAYRAWGAQLARSAPGGLISEDEMNFLDRPRTRACVVEEWVSAG
jgi:EthD domain